MSCSMETDRLISLLRRVGSDPELSPDQEKVCNALLKTIPKETLGWIADVLRRDPDCSSVFARKMEWMSEEHPPKAEVRNEPIGRLIRYFVDKKSKKVAYARPLLRSRFPLQSHQDQNRILRAFLAGSKGDCEWAARYLRDNWRKEMAGAVSAAWERTGCLTLSYVILRHFPNEYIFREKDRLEAVAGYQHVCARLGNEPSFEMDESRLNTPDYFYVMASLGRDVDADALEKRFYDYLLTCQYNYWPLHFTPVSLVAIEGVGKMIWAMGVLGMQDALVRLVYFMDRVMGAVENAPADEDHQRWPTFVDCLKQEINPFLPPDIFEEEQLRYRQDTAVLGYSFAHPEEDW